MPDRPTPRDASRRVAERREAERREAERRLSERRGTGAAVVAPPTPEAVRDPARLAALRATGLLEADRHEAMEHLAALAAATLQVPVVQVNLVTADAQVPLAAAVAPDDPAPERWRVPVGLDASFCRYAVGTGAPLVIQDARVHPLVADNHATTEAGVVAYAAAPVVAPGGQPLGTVCVVDFAPRAWTDAEVETLVRFAALASSQIALVATATQALGAADRELEARATRLEEKRLHLLAVIDQMPSGLLLAEAPSGRIVRQNAAAERIMRHPAPTAEDVGGYAASGGLHPDGTPYRGEEYPLARALRRGETVAQHEMRYRRGDGTETVLSVSAAPVRNAAGEIVAAVCTFEDVAERVAGETALRDARDAAAAARAVADQLRQEADAANRAKSAFLATMSHELRTPINAIVGYAELLEVGVAGPLTPQQREYLERQRASSQHLLHLISDVLDLAKVDAGELAVGREHATLTEAVASALDLTRPQAGVRGVRLIDACALPFPVSGGEAAEGGTEGAGAPAPDESPEHAAARRPVPAMYVGDEHRVRQILVNLLTNAVKFTEPGGTVTLTCGTEATAPADAAVHGRGPWAYVRVADTGIGIPEAEQARVFEPFHQVPRQKSSVYTRPDDGTGLGLAISRRLARLMGGDLVLESRPGAGSTFTLWLPAVPEGAGAPRRVTPAEPAAAVAAEGVAAGAVPAVQAVQAIQPAGMGAVGERLRALTEAILDGYVDRLRADRAIPQARAMRRAQLEDHASTLITTLAQSLVIAAEAEAEAPALLRDGSAIQRTIAEHHGARRQQQGWSEAAVRRGYQHLRETIAQAIRAHLSWQTRATDVTDALGLILGLLERAEDVSVRAWARMEQAAGGGRHGG